MRSIVTIIGPLVLAFVATVMSGCAGLRLPAIDPSGQRVFLPGRTTTFADDGPFARLLHKDRRRAVSESLPADPTLPNSTYPAIASDPSGPYRPYFSHDKNWFGLGRHGQRSGIGGGTPAFTSPPPPPDCRPGGNAPADAPCYPIGSPTQSSLNATLPNGPVGSGLGDFRLASSGPQLGPGVYIRPPRVVAAVGKEVVLVGGVQSSPGVLRPHQRLQWSLSQDSAGTLVDAFEGEKKFFGLTGLLKGKTCRGCGDFVETQSAGKCQLLKRDVSNPQDDVFLSRGESWVSLTSGSEGVSYVTLAAPGVASWDGRQQTAAVIWVDGKWSIPAPMISPIQNPAQLTTYVVRQTTGQPISQWTVRYSLLGGTPAQFEGSTTDWIDVPTNAQGEATVSLLPRNPVLGTTLVGVQIIRPHVLPGDNTAIVVGDGQTSVTWSGTNVEVEPVEIVDPSLPSNQIPQLPPETQIPTTPPPSGPTSRPSNPSQQQTSLAIVVDGPEIAQVNEPADYLVTISNTGNVPAIGLVLSTDLPARGVVFEGSVPEAIASGREIDWRLPTIPPAGVSKVRARFRFTEPLPQTNRFFVNAENAPQADDGRVTQVEASLAPPIVQILDPEPFTPSVGQRVVFGVNVFNPNPIPVQVNVVAGEWGRGLRPEVEEGNDVPPPNEGIRHPKFQVLARSTQLIEIPFETLEAGSWEFRLGATATRLAKSATDAEDSQPASSEPVTGLVRVVAGNRPGGPAAGNATSPLVVDVFSPKEDIAVGETSLFRIEVKNIGYVPLNNIVIRYQQEVELLPDQNSFQPSPTGFDNSQGLPVWEWQYPIVPSRQSLVIEFFARANPNPNAASARGIVTATSREGATGRRDFDVRFVEAGAGAGGFREGGTGGASRTLEAEFGPLADRPRIGDQVDFLLRVQSNGGAIPQAEVAIQISPDAQFTLNAEGPPGTRSSVEQGVLVFTPVAEIPAGSTLVYRFGVVSRQAGPLVALATISAPGVPTRQLNAETTVVP